MAALGLAEGCAHLHVRIHAELRMLITKEVSQTLQRDTLAPSNGIFKSFTLFKDVFLFSANKYYIMQNMKTL